MKGGFVIAKYAFTQERKWRHEGTMNGASGFKKITNLFFVEA
jgi:hypothetical protein